MEKSFASWSGGKDCCQAVYLAGKQGIDIRYLLNTVTQDNQRSCSHGMASKWIRLQSEAIGIPVIQASTTSDTYEAVFVENLKKLKAEGITTGVFGDIDFNPHREWIERVCGKAEIKPVLPLWLRDHGQVARDFIKYGFTAVVVAVHTDYLGPEWLGRRFDESFLKDLTKCKRAVGPCGEAGEFHTLVIDGPLFKKRMEIKETGKVQKDNHWFLDIKGIELVNK